MDMMLWNHKHSVRSSYARILSCSADDWCMVPTVVMHPCVVTMPLYWLVNKAKVTVEQKKYYYLYYIT